MTKTRGVREEKLGVDGSASRDVRVSTLFVEDDEYCIVSAPFGAGADSSGLTAAESEVARLAMDGFSNRAIAEMRGSAVRTVANQMASILQKLGAMSRVHIAARLGERAR
jgi:DNA-binding CsgD family transcriptional regulator